MNNDEPLNFDSLSVEEIESLYKDILEFDAGSVIIAGCGSVYVSSDWYAIRNCGYIITSSGGGYAYGCK